MSDGRKRRGFVLHAGQVGHVVVDRLHLAVDGVAVELGQTAALGLAGEQRDPEVECLLQISRQLRQHGDAAGGMKSADRDLNAVLAELTGHVHGARKLVRLHADQADHPARLAIAVALAQPLDDVLDRDDGVGLVIGPDLELDFAEQLLGPSCRA